MSLVAFDPGAVYVTSPELEKPSKLVEAVLRKGRNGSALWLYDDEGEAVAIVYLRADFFDLMMESVERTELAEVPA